MRSAFQSAERVHQIALAAAQTELDSMLQSHLVSQPIYEQFHEELKSQLETAESKITQLFDMEEAQASEEIHLTKVRLIAAEKSSIEKAVHEGLISAQSASNMIDAADRELDRITHLGEDSEN